MMKNHSNANNIIWHGFILIISITLSYFYREDITFSDIEPIVSILQNTSSMIFTIMGIWIAYIYPNAILRITQPSKIEAVFPLEDEKRVKLLVGIVVLSALILSTLVVGSIAKPFITKSTMFLEHPEIIKSISLFILLWLSYAQLFCLYIVIASSVNFIIDLKNKHHTSEINKKF